MITGTASAAATKKPLGTLEKIATAGNPARSRPRFPVFILDLREASNRMNLPYWRMALV
jgi:hypothetical protein